MEGIGEVCIKESLFHACIAEATADYGGGGIEINSTQKPPRIENTEFILCKSGNDGAGVGIWSSPIYQGICLSDCSFEHCPIKHTSSSDGGSTVNICYNEH